MLPLSMACVGPTDRTRVTGRMLPGQIRFVTIVEADPGESGGWRAACIHIRSSRDNTGQSILCRFGIETPIHNVEGPISTPLAQRIAADRINEATQSIFSAATLESPLGMLCESVKATLRTTVPASIAGSRVPSECHARSVPVQFGDFNL
ncbi:hypothetical protein HMI50_09055 [Corallococcus carmarthensis]|uniref:Uncharacterized protein n=1 Tax=Corallococcus carmarthensis TaxID=2316728 RepID=A0A3A8K1E4_9BACT|nr:hypothetical protein [Corallococcus carmarthensis]NOK17173.1 hypothetical protein [Corallococcus carmarthensis]RKH01973.1 hypothetical protein D7X32_18465 [Corallococcus carmarthensis]